MSEIIGSYDQDTLITSRLSSVGWWLTWSSILCSYISFIMVLYFCFKFPVFGSAFGLLRSGTVALPTHLPPYLFYGDEFKEEPHVSNSSNHIQLAYDDEMTIIDLTTVFLVARLVILFLLLWLYINFMRNKRLFVVLEIGSHAACVRIRCLCLHSAIYAYKFLAESYIQTLSVTQCLPKLMVDWLLFQISHVLRETSLKFPNDILISPWSAWKIKHILRDKTFYVLCLLEFNANYRLVDFESTVQLSSHAVLLGENDESS